MDEPYAEPESAGPITAMGNSYGAGQALDALAFNQRHRPPTVREQIAARTEALRKQLAEHEAVLVLLDSAPDVEKVLNAMRRIGV